MCFIIFIIVSHISVVVSDSPNECNAHTELQRIPTFSSWSMTNPKKCETETGIQQLHQRHPSAKTLIFDWNHYCFFLLFGLNTNSSSNRCHRHKPRTIRGHTREKYITEHVSFSGYGIFLTSCFFFQNL